MAHTPIYPNSTPLGDNDIARTKVVPYLCPQLGKSAHDGGSLNPVGQSDPLCAPSQQPVVQNDSGHYGQRNTESIREDADINSSIITKVGRASAGQFYAPRVSSRALDRDTKKALSPEEIEEWSMKIKWIWKPECLLEIRQRCGCAGPLFLAQLDCDLHLHLGVGRDGVDLCAVWRSDECVMWNNLVGFCSMWPPIPTREQADSFNAQMRPIIRRNCFLLGGRIEATPEERKEWIQWLAKHAHHR